MERTNIGHDAPAGLALERIRFGEFLVEMKIIDDGQLLDALAEHWAHGGRFGHALWRRGVLSEDEVERLAAEFHALNVVEVGFELPSAREVS